MISTSKKRKRYGGNATALKLECGSVVKQRHRNKMENEALRLGRKAVEVVLRCDSRGAVSGVCHNITAVKAQRL